MTSSVPPESPEVAEALALLAHDLKNPLAAVLTNIGYVRGFVESLDANGRPEVEDVRDAIVDARQACDALQRFVSNLELLARDLGNNRRPPVETPPLDLSAIADDVVSRQRAAAESRRLELAVRVSETACWARGDRDLVLRACDNLIANAVQHAPARSRIEVTVERTDGDAILTVTDDGVSIPDDARADAVSRAGQSRAKGRPEARYGRGLGLYSAAIAARAAGGRLDVGTRDGKSALSIVLPCYDEG